MNWYFLFYLVTISEKLSEVFFTLGVFVAVIMVIVVIFCIVYRCNIGEEMNRCEPEQDKVNHYEKMFIRGVKGVKISGAIVMFCFILSALLPSKSDMMIIIAGGGVGNYVANSEEMKELPDDLVKYFRSELEKARLENLPEPVK